VPQTQPVKTEALEPAEMDLFDLAPCGLVICDAQCMVLRANPFFVDMIGHPTDVELEPQPFQQLLTRASRFIFNAQVLPRLDLGGQAREVAFDLQVSDGQGGVKTAAILLNGSHDRGSDRFHFALFPAQDRREHERQLLKTQKELTKSNEFLELAEKLAHVGHWRVDLTTGEAHWSSEIYNIIGCDPSIYVPRFGQSAALYHEDDRDSINVILNQAIANGEPFTYAKRIRRQDTGEIRHVQVSGICERDPRGVVTGLFGVFHDITDMVEANEIREATEARYRLLADHSNDIITVFNLFGKIEYISPAVTKILGYDPGELIGRNVRDIIHADDYAATQAAYHSYVTGKDWDDAPRIQYRARHKDGTYVWAEAHPTLIFDVSGSRVIAFQDVVRDISDQKAFEEALAKASLEANAAAEAKAQFLATMSHELRTPLTSIIGFSGLLRDLLDGDESLRSHSQRIYTAGQGLLSLINDILDHSKLEADQLDLDLAPANVGELAEEVAELLGFQAKAKGLQLILTGADSLPHALMVDEVRLRQILLNLTGNAIKFTSEGAVTLSLSMQSHEHGDSLHVSIRDTGVGISEDGQRHLFKRFSQVDRTVESNAGGTGLGLLICKQLVELMGGHIGVTSKLGEGSEFSFDIPVRSATDDDVGDEKPRLTGHILVVDDQEAIRDLMTGLLAPDGHSVDTARDGAEAIRACLETPYDLIFMDLNMPVMDGFLAAKGIRATCAPNMTTPIVALTAGGTSRRQACLTAGMNDFLTKPVNPTTLAACVANWLDAKHHSQRMESTR
jgi:PAS domain S-box-containing protein